VSIAFFLFGLANYVFTYVASSRFTNMSALMFTTSVLIFLIGLVSEQITQLIYRPTQALDRQLSATRSAAQSGRRATGT
jgi:hypothetical protein